MHKSSRQMAGVSKKFLVLRWLASLATVVLAKPRVFCIKFMCLVPFQWWQLLLVKRCWAQGW